MRTYLLTDLRELAPYARDWDRLAGGVPFRSWTWLSTWWQFYGENRPAARLFVPCVFDDRQRLVGVAPWYLDEVPGWGRIVRPLGSGEICSDYLSLLCEPGRATAVAAVLADFLTDATPEGRQQRPAFDRIELAGVDTEDRTLAELARHLGERGNTLHCRPGFNCWRIPLPDSMDDYLATLSRSHRKQLRRLKRNLLETPRAVVHEVRTLDQLGEATGILIDLHQRRWQAVGEPGCFRSSRFEAFHRAVMPEMLRAGSLKLSWLEIDGQPAAAEYGLAGDDIVYAYQSGVAPDLRELEPGRLLAMAAIAKAIEQGFRGYDLLRGDEPYKAHWRAVRRPTVEWRIVPRLAAAQLRHNLWRAGSRVKRWLKHGLKLVEKAGD